MTKKSYKKTEFYMSNYVIFAYIKDFNKFVRILYIANNIKLLKNI